MGFEWSRWTWLHMWHQERPKEAVVHALEEFTVRVRPDSKPEMNREVRSEPRAYPFCVSTDCFAHLQWSCWVLGGAYGASAFTKTRILLLK